jgi:hypothetical protein
MMVLEPSIINIGPGRTAAPELALAAYGVAFSLALLVEAPIDFAFLATLRATAATRIGRCSKRDWQGVVNCLGEAIASSGKASV